MIMNEQFHATLKLVTGEEVLARVMKTMEEGEVVFLLDEPIVIEENNSVDAEKGVMVSGLTPKKWLGYAGDDLVILYKHHVVSMTEMDRFGVDFYEKAVLAARITSPLKRKVKQEEHSGYLGSTKDFREYLEDMYDNSPDIPNDH